MLQTVKYGFGILSLAAICSAAGSVASVTSAQPFSVDGVQLSNRGVNSWPLISNDEVETAAGYALMTFRDGSAIKLAPQSRVRIGGYTTAPEVTVLAGNIETRIAPGSKLIVNRDMSASADNDQNNGSVPDNDPAATTGARTNNNTTFRKAALLYFASAVALAGLGLAVDAILQPAAVSNR